MVLRNAVCVVGVRERDYDHLVPVRTKRVFSGLQYPSFGGSILDTAARVVVPFGLGQDPDTNLKVILR